MGRGVYVTFNNISAISWLSVLLVKEIGVPGENLTCRTSLITELLSHNVSSTPLPSWIRIHNVSGNYRH